MKQHVERQEPAGGRGVNRRTLARGAVWSVPVIAAATVAPAVAASPQPELEPAGRGTWNLSWYTERIDNYRSYKLFSVQPGTTVPGQGFCVVNTKSTTSISNGMVTYYVPYGSLTFTAQDGPGFNGWSQLSRDTSKSNKYYNGVTYYAYTSVYTGGITARNGTTCFPSYGFESDDYLDSSGYFFAYHSVIVDGTRQSANYGPVSMIG